MQQSTTDGRFETSQAACLPPQGLHKLLLQGGRKTQPAPMQHCPSEALQVHSSFEEILPCSTCGERLPACCSAVPPAETISSPAADPVAVLSGHPGSPPSHMPSARACVLKDAKPKSLIGTVYLGKGKRCCKRDYIPVQTPTITTSLAVTLPP